MVTRAKHVALLRGINVGGKNKLPMKELVTLFTDVGCDNVTTYIQSGNIVFSASQELAARVPELVADGIRDRFGYRVPVVLRSAAEIAAVVSGNPFLDSGADIAVLHVAYLAEFPGADEVAALDPNRSPPDEFVVRDRDIYLRCPNGVARTKLSNAYFDSKLKTTSTMRNWKTTLKVLELVEAPDR